MELTFTEVILLSSGTDRRSSRSGIFPSYGSMGSRGQWFIARNDPTGVKIRYVAEACLHDTGRSLSLDVADSGS
jgi:hypothetical protein